MPYIVLRPSIIVGDSKTGEVGIDKMVYGVAKIYHLLTRLVKREYRDRGGIPAELKYYVKGDPKEILTTLDLERLPDVKRYGGFTLAYETMSRQLETFSIPETPGYLAYTIVDNSAIMVSDPLSSTSPAAHMHTGITTPPSSLLTTTSHPLIHMNC